MSSTDLPNFGDGYEVIRELGHDGLREVFLAKNRMMDRLEVIKITRFNTNSSMETSGQFLKEIQSAAKLNHINIVTAYSTLQLPDGLGLAVEFIDGIDLEEEVQNNGPMPIPKACNAIIQTARALQYALDQGLCHRGIKPSHLIASNFKDRLNIKVVDFGLGRIEEDSLHDWRFTSPEQLLDPKRLDTRSDIYSLGCTFYFLLSGVTPFVGDSTELKHAHLHLAPKPLIGLPKELWQIVAKMLAKNPGDRFQTPKDVEKALSPWLKKPIVLDSVKPEESPETQSLVLPAPALIPKTVAQRRKQPLRDAQDVILVSAKSRESAPRRNPAFLPLLIVGFSCIAIFFALFFTFQDEGEIPLGAPEQKKEDFSPSGLIPPPVQTPEPTPIKIPEPSPGEEKTKTKRGKKSKQAVAETPEPVWVSLFNGKDLSGWRQKNVTTREAKWSVQDGVLTGSIAPSYLLTQRSDYQQFRFRVEVKLSPGANSGQIFHYDEPRFMEVDLFDIETGTILSGYNRNFTKLAVAPNQGILPNRWFTQEVEVNEGKITVRVDGKLVALHEDSTLNQRNGSIGVQTWWNNAGRIPSVSFRKIEVMELGK
jgi:serine/threonine protein kinase